MTSGSLTFTLVSGGPANNPEYVLYFFAGVAAVLGLYVLLFRYRRVEQDTALIVHKNSKVEVTFSGSYVLPVIHRAELMDLSVKTLEIKRTGADSLICKGKRRVELRATFSLRVNNTEQDVRCVSSEIGCEPATDPETLEGLFAADFAEALKVVAKKLAIDDVVSAVDIRARAQASAAVHSPKIGRVRRSPPWRLRSGHRV